MFRLKNLTGEAMVKEKTQIISKGIVKRASIDEILGCALENMAGSENLSANVVKLLLQVCYDPKRRAEIYKHEVLPARLIFMAVCEAHGKVEVYKGRDGKFYYSFLDSYIKRHSDLVCPFTRLT